MPGGHPETSFRSSPSSNEALTFIDSANAPSVMRRCSRWACNLGPSPGLEFNDILGTLRDKPIFADLTNIEAVQRTPPLHKYEDRGCKGGEQSDENR
jgi:hypothetical protein